VSEVPAAKPPGFDPWTADEVQALTAHRADEAAGVRSGPKGAMAQCMAAWRVLALRERIDGAGDGAGFDVLEAVSECAMAGLQMPEWLEDAFLQRYRSVQQLRAKSWDDPNAFGPPYPKSFRLAERRQRRLQRMEIAGLVMDYRQSGTDPLDALWNEFDGNPKSDARGLTADLSERVRRMGIASSKAQELYAEAIAMGLLSSALSAKSAGRRRLR